jgi:hypothetical protein
MMPPLPSGSVAQRIGQGVGMLVVALFGGLVLTGLVLSLGTLIGVAIRAARWAAGGC